MKIQMEIQIPIIIDVEIEQDRIRVENYKFIFKESDIKNQFTKFLESTNFEI